MASELRFAAATILLLAATVFLRVRGGRETIPPNPQLESLPERIGHWSAREEIITPDVLETLGAGDFLARTFRTDPLDASPVSLFVGYFPSQRLGTTLHSPKNCLPGAGWMALQSRRVTINLPGLAPIDANRYVVAKGTERGLVLYWYWAHGRSTASEYWAKVYLVEDSIRFNRSDGSLIRFSTRVQERENEEAAEQRLLSAVRDIVPVLAPYLPS